MQIYIEEDLRKYYKFNFEKNIKNFIQYVPGNHIAHLDKIEVLVSGSRENGIGGYYSGKREQTMPKIVLYPKSIFNKMPKILFYIFPLIPKLLFASALYHEIGHHYQRITPGIKKEKWEQDATTYERKVIRAAFKYYRWILFVLFIPILLIKKLISGRKRT